jgi:hypothetical protein
VDVTISYAVTENSSAATCSLGVSSSEPRDAHGQTNPDWAIADAHHVSLRAERGAEEPIYTVTVICRDSSGHEASRAARVLVPHDRRR